MMIKHSPILTALLLGAPFAVSAQEASSPALWEEPASPSALATTGTPSAARDFVAEGAAPAGLAMAAPQGQAKPEHVHHESEKGVMEVGFGYAYVRFRSSPFNASLHGLNTSFAYYISRWLAVEGDVSSAFGSQSSSTADSKYVFYGAGVKVVGREARVQPWARGLLGGIHMSPQTNFSNNGFALMLGGGADLRLRSWLSWRVEANYVRSQLYTQGQNNLQAGTGIVYRF
jgi:hypothetical protein